MGKTITFFVHAGLPEFDRQCVDVCEATGCVRVAAPQGATFAIAPRLTRKLPQADWAAPELGTLIFHPSILPYHRGPDAIRWTVHLGERVSGVTWFWCDDGLDTGSICEQEAVLLKTFESAGRAYHTRFLPAGIRALQRAVAGIVLGEVRRLAQDHELATYESLFPPMPVEVVKPGVSFALTR